MSKIKWHVHHRACDPKPNGNDYWFAVERVDDSTKLLSWTTHLLGKRWMTSTDWPLFLYGHRGIPRPTWWAASVLFEAQKQTRANLDERRA